MTDPVLFVLSVLTLLCTPGPTNTLLATSGAVVGVRRSLPLLLAELVGYLFAILTIRLALKPFFETPSISVGFKVLVALYLAYTAIKLWTVPAATARSVVRTWNVFATTLLNPKAFVFAIGIIPNDAIHVAPYFAAFSTCVTTVGFLWLVFGRVAGAQFGLLVPRIASVALGGFASLIIVSIVS